MRRLLGLLFVAFIAASPALAASGPNATAAPAPTCSELPSPSAAAGRIQLAQSSCRGACSSSRGYCLSTCRDSFCRAVCNDRYQSCLDSCRR